MAISGSDSHSQSQSQSPSSAAVTKPVSQVPVVVEVESVQCDSCGFTEECTPAYISLLRHRFHGHWLCGLCAEAVKDEVTRSQKLITMEEAVERHISFCREFRSSSLSPKTEHPIFVMGRILRRSLDSPRHLRSSSSGALNVGRVRGSSLLRSESCFPSIG
ncbi:uncharacterized protein LOC130714236 [Lotus japonicus]|uniref:uncharacterized protein LOC130714236 n=1 Tax=Lotus japonicus TaxID=34305 RepID=UPI00258BBC46|nr:uncharacterized protein LOC130714236 [Lotus japonicus]